MFWSRCETGFAGGQGEGVSEVLGHISICSCSLAPYLCVLAFILRVWFLTEVSEDVVQKPEAQRSDVQWKNLVVNA